MKIATLRVLACTMFWAGSIVTGWSQQAPAVASVSQVLPFAGTGTVTTLLEGETAVVGTTSGSTTAQGNTATPAAAGGRISTGEDGASSLVLGSTGTARIGADSEVKVPATDEKSHSLELLKGRLFLNISGDELKKHAAGEFKLKTPAALLAVKGTKFFAVSVNGADVVGVHEGSVEVTEPTSGTSVTVAAGNLVTVSPGSISEPREITDLEKAYTKEYAAADLVRTPIPLVIKSPVPNTKKLQILLFQNGRLSVVGEESMDRINHGTLLESKIGPYIDWRPVRLGGTSVGTPISPQMSADGVVQYAWKDASVSMGGYSRTFYQLSFEYRGQTQSAGEPVALQFRVRTKNIATATFNDPMYGSSTRLAVLSDGGGWVGAQMLPRKERLTKSSADLLTFVYKAMNIQTLKPGKSGALPSQKPVSIEFTDFVLLSLPK